MTCVCHTQIVKTAPVPAEPAGLAASVRRGLPEATRPSAYEAGCAAFVRHHARTPAGSTPLVVNPASSAVAATEQGKPERRAAKTVAIDGADGRFGGIALPPEAEERARLLPRTRGQRVEPRATIARQSKTKRPQCGLIAPSRRRMSRTRDVREIAAWSLAPARRVRLTCLAAPWRCATRQLSEIRRLLQAQAAAHAERANVYRVVF